jgi:uncharacterized protein YceK
MWVKKIIMTRFVARLALVGLLASSIVGCGTYVARIENKPFASSADYYRGTKTVLSVLGFEEAYAAIFCYATIVCPIVLLVSLPVDFVVDTLSLPYDYVYADRNKRLAYSQAMKQAKHGSIKFDFKASNNLGSERKTVDYRLRYTHEYRVQHIYLDVDSVPLIGGTAVIYIPGYEGYTPDSLGVSYGGLHVRDIDMYLKRDTVYFSRSWGAVRNDTKFHESGTTFIYSDARLEGEVSEVYITPSIVGG